MLKKIYIAILATGLAACSSQMKISQYQQQLPKLDLQQYLNGNIKGYGIVQDGSGNVTKRFKFKGAGKWTGNDGKFYETITYSDGKVESRIWTLTKFSDSMYEAKTPDVIGKATINVAGNAMNWHYNMNVKVDDSTYKINFDDWMFLMNDGKMINRNYFHKFGVNVGELTMFMEKDK